MNYDDALLKVERFLSVSGLRTFCREVCHGACCQNTTCRAKTKSCHRPTLICATIICEDLNSTLVPTNLLPLYRKGNEALDEFLKMPYNNLKFKREEIFSFKVDKMLKSLDFPEEIFSFYTVENANVLSPRIKRMERFIRAIDQRKKKLRRRHEALHL